MTTAVLPPWLVPALVAAAALHLLGDVLAPFVLAGVLAYIFEPLVIGLNRLGVPRSVASALVLTLLVAMLAGVVLLMVPLLLAQTAALAERLPQMLALLREHLAALLAVIADVGVPGLGSSGLAKPGAAGAGELPLADLQALAARHAAEISAGLRSGLLRAGEGGAVLAGWLGMLVLFPVVLFYALRDLPRIGPALLALCPGVLRDDIAALAADADAVLGEFVRGQLAVMAVMAVVYAVSLTALGVPHALSIGVMAGLLTFIPLLGVVSGAILGVGAATLLPGEVAPVWAVVAVFAGGNLLENFVVTPWLVGERIGLHPLTVIFALLAFGQLFGVSGVLVALPATAVLQAWLRRWQRVGAA